MPEFDPSQPFESVEFDPSQPFDPVDSGGGTATLAPPAPRIQALTPENFRSNYKTGMLADMTQDERRDLARGVAKNAMNTTPWLRNAMAVGPLGMSLDALSMGGRFSNMIAHGMKRLGMNTEADEHMPDFLNMLSEEAGKIASEGDKDNKIISPFVAEAGRSVLRSAIPAVASGGMAPAIAYGSGVAGNQAITEGKEKGLEGLPLAAYAGGQAAIEGGTEALTAKLGGGFLRRLGMKVQPTGAMELAKATLGEGAQEGVTNVAQSLLRRTIDPAALDSLGSDTLKAAFAGSLGGAGFHGIATAADTASKAVEIAKQVKSLDNDPFSVGKDSEDKSEAAPEGETPEVQLGPLRKRPMTPNTSTTPGSTLIKTPEQPTDTAVPPDKVHPANQENVPAQPSGDIKPVASSESVKETEQPVEQQSTQPTNRRGLQGMPAELSPDQRSEWKEIRNNVLSPDQAMRLSPEQAQLAYSQSPKAKKVRPIVVKTEASNVDPGSPKRVEIMRNRLDRGEGVFQAGDKPLVPGQTIMTSEAPTAADMVNPAKPRTKQQVLEDAQAQATQNQTPIAPGPLRKRNAQPKPQAQPGYVAPELTQESPEVRQAAEASVTDKLDVAGALFQFQHVLGKPLVAHEPSTPQEHDAAAFAREHGLEPVFVKAHDGSQLPDAGFSLGKVVALRSGMEDHALWDIVGHEVAHGIGVDAKNSFDKSLVNKYADKYLANVSKSRQEDVASDPAMRAREGSAMLVGEFAKSKSLRDQIRKGSPSFYTQIRDKILQAVGLFSPKHKAFRETIDAFKAEREKVNPVQPAQSSAASNPIQDVRQAADISEATAPRIESLGFFGGTGARHRPNSTPVALQAQNPDAERQLSQSEGESKDGILTRLAKWGEPLWHAFTRPNQNIPNDGEHGTMNEMFRLLDQHVANAQDEANRNIGAVVEPLTTPQLQLFTRKLVIDNLLASIDRGEPMRFGFKDRAEVEQYQQQLNALVAADPDVQKSLARRAVMVQAMYVDLLKHDLIDNLDPKKVETYYHQQVLSYLGAAKHGRNPQITKKSFQKKRVTGKGDVFDESQNYNTSYIEADHAWMSDAYTQIAKERWLRDLAKRYDITKQLERQAAINGTTFEDELHAVKDKYEQWQATPGNKLYRVTGVAERVVADVLAGLAPSASVKPDDLFKVIAQGAKLRQLVLPVELVAQLDSMRTPTSSGNVFLDGVINLAKQIQNSLKTHFLFSPARVLPYNLRNVTGDADPLIGGAAGAVLHIPNAIKEMADYYGIVRQSRLALTPDMEAARNHGVMDAAFAASESVDLKELDVFRRFYGNEKQGIVTSGAKLYTDYLRIARRLSNFREAVGRYAAFKYYRQALRNGTLAHYGGASKAVVDRIHKEMGVDPAAAHLSRNLFGDYGNLTVFGRFMRQYVAPFYSWTEVNLKRYPQIVWNAAAYGPRKTKQLGIDNPAAAGALSAAAVGMVALPYIAKQLYNNLLWPDEEKELSPIDRAMPHLIYSRNKDGSIGNFRNVGALGDFLENFGVGTALSRMDELNNGQMSPSEVATEAMKAVVAKHANSVRPEMKAGLEVITGRTGYPDPFNTRPQAWDMTLAKLAGFPDTYRDIRGRILQDGSRMRPHPLERVFGVTDPKMNALMEISELRDRYREKLDERGQFKPNQFMSNMRAAANMDNPEAFAEARTAYLTHGKGDELGNFKKFMEHQDRLDPISGLKQSQEKDFIERYLSPEQRQKLQMARDFGIETKEKVQLMWNDAAKNDPPELKAKLQDQKEEFVAAKYQNVVQQKPTAITPKERKEGVTLDAKIAKWQSDRLESIDALNGVGMTKDEVIAVIAKKMNEEIKSVGKKSEQYDQEIAAKARAADGRRAKLRQLRRALESGQ